MKHLFKIKLILIICTIFFVNFSCSKNKTQCTGNCADITVSGRIYNKLTGGGISNALLTLSWRQRGICIFCGKNEIYNGVTKADGSFNFNTTIDTSRFLFDNLALKIPKDTNYLSVSYSGDFYEESLRNFAITGLQNINIELYPKTNLKINVKRILNDVFTNYNIIHSFASNYQVYDLYLNSQINSRDTILNVETATGIFTKITSTKNNLTTTVSQKVDSILCTPNGNNTITVNY